MPMKGSAIHSVRALCADGGGPWRARHPGRRSSRCSPLLAGLPGVSDACRCRAARCRLSTCTARCRACRSRSRRGSKPFRPRFPTCRRLPKTACRRGKAAWPPRQIAGWPRLVRQSGTWQRSQPIDSAAHAVAHSRSRCDLRQPAEKSQSQPTRQTLREHPDILDFTADLTDFSETAALVCCLDLVITVDTSVAHLAAALGRPTWILLPYTPDYRWLLDRDDSPWYPTARLFRQSSRRDYGEVLDRVRSELAVVAATAPMPKYPASLGPPRSCRGATRKRSRRWSGQCNSIQIKRGRCWIWVTFRLISSDRPMHC